MIKYTTKEGIFEVEFHKEIPWDDLHSINDKPAYRNEIFKFEEWRNNGLTHRLSGPAKIFKDGRYSFWLNGTYYEDVNSWLENHPNKDITFQTQMRLKY